MMRILPSCSSFFFLGHYYNVFLHDSPKLESPIPVMMLNILTSVPVWVSIIFQAMGISIQSRLVKRHSIIFKIVVLTIFSLIYGCSVELDSRTIISKSITKGMEWSFVQVLFSAIYILILAHYQRQIAAFIFGCTPLGGVVAACWKIISRNEEPEPEPQPLIDEEAHSSDDRKLMSVTHPTQIALRLFASSSAIEARKSSTILARGGSTRSSSSVPEANRTPKPSVPIGQVLVYENNVLKLIMVVKRRHLHKAADGPTQAMSLRDPGENATAAIHSSGSRTANGSNTCSAASASDTVNVLANSTSGLALLMYPSHLMPC